MKVRHSLLSFLRYRARWLSAGLLFAAAAPAMAEGQVQSIAFPGKCMERANTSQGGEWAYAAVVRDCDATKPEQMFQLYIGTQPATLAQIIAGGPFYIGVPEEDAYFKFNNYYGFSGLSGGRATWEIGSFLQGFIFHQSGAGVAITTSTLGTTFATLPWPYYGGGGTGWRYVPHSE